VTICMACTSEIMYHMAVRTGASMTGAHVSMDSYATWPGRASFYNKTHSASGATWLMSVKWVEFTGRVSNA